MSEVCLQARIVHLLRICGGSIPQRPKNSASIVRTIAYYKRKYYLYRHMEGPR